MKEIEKYVGYYLGVYVVVLAICGFFQYFYYCQGQSLICAVSMHRINTIITTTAYVLTPIVAIVGFLSWKKQFNSQQISKLSFQIISLLNTNYREQLNLLYWISERKNSYDELKSSEDFNHKVQEIKDNTAYIYSLISDLSRFTLDNQLNRFLNDWNQGCNIFISDLKVLNTKLTINQINLKLRKHPEYEIDFIPVYVNLDKLQFQLIEQIRKYSLV